MIDETGNRYGRLVVLRRAASMGHYGMRWVCQCDCGETTVVLGSLLRNGHVRSCGCGQSRKLDLLPGARYGRLTVVRRVKPYGAEWVFRCDCGREVVARGSDLVHGYKVSCGCVHKPDLTGRRFGSLTVLRQARDDEHRHATTARYWLCRCDCGGEAVASTSDLNKGKTRSCGCRRLKMRA